MRVARLAAAAAFALAGGRGCAAGECGGNGAPASCPAAPPRPGIALADVTEAAGDLADHPASVTSGWGNADMYSGGVAFLDVDGDDLPDLVLARTSLDDPALQGLVLLLGRGDGTFADATAVAGLTDGGACVGVAAADLDGDGRVDLFVPTDGEGDRLWLQRAPLAFEEVGAVAGVRGDGRRSRSVALLDADLDGWLDVYVSRWEGAGPAGHYGGQDSWIAPNVLYRNRGDGTFEDVTATAGVDCDGRSTLGAGAADLDGDADPDLYVANDFFDDCLYENLGDGTFADVSAEAGVGPHAINGMGVAFGDADGDGLAEIVVTDDLRPDASTGNAFYWNLGGLRFASAALDVGLDGGESVNEDSAVYWGAGWRDFDGDGDLELQLAQQSTGPSWVFELDATAGRFVPVGADRFDARYDVRGSAYADYDRDGRTDLVLLARGGPPRLYRNVGADGAGWIRVRATAPPGNAAGIGATVTVAACGRTLVRIVEGGTGYLSASEPVLTIGLGACAMADRVEARFPGGRTGALENVPAGADVTIPSP